MKTIALFVAAGLVLAAPHAACGAGEVPAAAQPLYRIKPSERNAALKYWEASAGMPTGLSAKIAEVNLDEVGTTPESAKKSAAYATAAAAAEAYGAGIWIHATTYAKCDFEVRYEEGIMAMLPHLGKMRDGARYLKFEARRQLVNGKPDEAAAILAAIIKMANHSCGDGFLISSLVGNAIAVTAVKEIAVLAESGQMTEAGRDQIRKALDGIDEKDPMRMRAALVGEQTVMLDWIRATYTGQDAGLRLAGMVFESLQNDDPLSQVNRTLIEKMDEATLARELEQTSLAYEAMLEAWDSEDAVTACEAVNTRLRKLEFGPLAAELCPAVKQARGALEKFKSDVKECRETLYNATIADEKPAE